jgi:TRAP-type C4-dicarboxylate transport system permease small subunit
MIEKVIEILVVISIIVIFNVVARIVVKKGIRKE